MPEGYAGLSATQLKRVQRRQRSRNNTRLRNFCSYTWRRGQIGKMVEIANRGEATQPDSSIGINRRTLTGKQKSESRFASTAAEKHAPGDIKPLFYPRFTPLTQYPDVGLKLLRSGNY